MSVVVIKNSDKPLLAEFMRDDEGNRLVFNSHEEADDYLMTHAEGGIGYRQFDGED